ncbi:hypothetical protein C8J44_2758 [Sphingomonas sp. PP-CE-3A-406]|nr:hypothetical protein C8J44_2758 [Sphingomonas sp. PP-CE-3A-406]
MTSIFRLAGVLAFALAPTSALAQGKIRSTGSNGTTVGLSGLAYGAEGDTATPVTQQTPLPTTAGPLPPAASVALSGAVTTGTTVVGPFAPQLGRGIRVILRGTWAGTFAVGTSVDACATINPLTIGGMTWGSFTGSANEIVDIPTLAGVVYCATATVSSGSLSYGVRQ